MRSDSVWVSATSGPTHSSILLEYAYFLERPHASPEVLESPGALNASESRLGRISAGEIQNLDSAYSAGA